MEQSSKTIRVLRIITQLSRGGVEAKLAALLPLLKKRGLDVAVCCVKEAGSLAERFEEASIPVHVFPVRSRLHPIDLLRLARFIRKTRIDVVHTHMYASNISGTVAARLANVPVIISNVHNVGKFKSSRQVRTDRLLSRFRSATVCVSERVRSDYMATTGLSGESMSVIYNGVNTELFKPRSLWEAANPGISMRLRQELGIGQDERVIVAAGRLIPQKSPELLIHALKEVRESCPNARLLLLGSGELRDALVALANELGLGNAVVFAGYREDAAELFSAADVFVSSSVKEGFSNVLVEALASGLPAVVTDVGGNREALTDGEQGFLCEASVGALTQCLTRILGDSALYERMSKSARSRAMTFGLDKMADQTVSLYEKLLSIKREGK
ncbi:glycosyltransferase [bacterium]|nr:glycosyltransferase [bacterium]